MEVMLIAKSLNMLAANPCYVYNFIYCWGSVSEVLFVHLLTIFKAMAPYIQDYKLEWINNSKITYLRDNFKKMPESESDLIILIIIHESDLIT